VADLVDIFGSSASVALGLTISCMGKPGAPPPGTRQAAIVLWILLALAAFVAALAWSLYLAGRL
jgi:hypothetical protein